MSNITDQHYLRHKQYQDSCKLSARATLHQRFHTNDIGWHRWVFNHLTLDAGMQILELGSGPGYLWQENKGSIPIGANIILTDLSRGMLQEALENLAHQDNFLFCSADAAQLPFGENAFDVVIANHMLYHLASISDALGEIYRVIRPGKFLYAATNGQNHLREIREWKTRFMPEKQPSPWGTPTTRFSLENGGEKLKHFFPEVDVYTYSGHLLVTETEPIIQYINSYLDQEMDPQTRKNLEGFLRDELKDKNGIKITTDTGLFIAAKR